MEQNYSKLKSTLEELIKTDLIGEYIKISLSNIKTISNFYELEQSILLFILIERKYKKHTEERYSKDYSELIHEIQIKYTQLANNISGNLKLLREVIYLYEIISKIPNIKPWDSFIDIVQQVRNQYKQLAYSSDIQVFVNDMLMLGEILILDKNYLKNYLQRVFVLNIHTMTNFEYNTFLKQFLKYHNVEVDFILECLNELFDEDKYFSLKSIERRSIFNWSLHFTSNIPEYHNHNNWSILYPKLKNLLFKHLKNDQLNEGMHLEFFIWHIMGNLYQTQDEMKKFNEEITYPASLYYKRDDLLKCKKTHNKKIKIALVKDRIAMTSVTKVEISLLETVLKNEEFKANYEISIYSCDYFEKSQDDPAVIKLFEELGVNVYNPNSDTLKTLGFYGNHYKKAIKLRETIIENNTDIMIVGTNNFPLVNFLFVNRTADKQIYWSHGNSTYNVENIDKRISHFMQRDNIFDFEIFGIFLDLDRYNPKVDMNEIKRIRDNYPKDASILGTIGRLIKVDSFDYLKTVAKIMKVNPKTIFLACGSGNQQGIKEKIRKLGVENRFYFPGQIDPHAYGHLIDLYLTPFPAGGGEALQEYRFKGKPYVCLHNCDYSIIEKNDLINLIASIRANKYFKKNLKISTNYSKNIYTEEVLNNLENNLYLDEVNKKAQMYYEISLTSSVEEYENVANKFLEDKKLVDLVCKDFLYVEKTKRDYIKIFIDILN